jgi:hypothetical protein
MIRGLIQSNRLADAERLLDEALKLPSEAPPEFLNELMHARSGLASSDDHLSQDNQGDFLRSRDEVDFCIYAC